MKQFFMTSEGIALFLAALVFIVTITLVVLRVIGFWITLLLLLFSLLVGFTVGNMGAFQEYLRCRQQRKWTELTHDLQNLQEEMVQLKDSYSHLKEQWQTQHLLLKSLMDDREDQNHSLSELQEEPAELTSQEFLMLPSG